MTVNQRLVKASEPFATRHLCLDCLQDIEASSLAVISQLLPDFAALIEIARQVTVVLNPAHDFRYIGYDYNTASFSILCRWRQPSVATDFAHGYRSVLN